MQITASRETLMLALSRVQGIVGKKTTMPILSNVLIETAASDRFTMTATDLEIFAKGTYEGLTEKAGRICVNARDLHDIVRNLPAGNVSLEVEDDKNVRVSSGRIRYRLHTVEASDYPAMPGFGQVSYFPLPAALLLDVIDHTLFAVASDDPRIFLNGVNVEKVGEDTLRLVSTDGHRLSLVERKLQTPPPFERRVIIPRKGLVELRRLLEEGGEEVELAFTESSGYFKRPDLLLVMRLIEGEFPDYNMVIPKRAERTVIIGRAALSDALRRISILSSDRSHGVRFRLAPGEFNIEASNPEKGEGKETLDVEYKGAEFQAGFNARYFLEAAAVMKGEEVALDLTDELSPCVARDAGDPGFLCVVMPMRIS